MFLEELKKFQPDVFEGSKKALEKNNKKIPLEESMLIPSISVDYAVMEKLKNKSCKSSLQMVGYGVFRVSI